MAFVNIASGANHSLRYAAETTPGTTPDSPGMTELAHTSCSLILSRDTLTSNALRADRMIPFTRTGTNKISGDIGFELLAGEYDPLLAAALAGTWTDNVLKAGKTVTSFTFERAFTDIARYGVFTGCFMNSLSLSIKPGALITGSFGIIGLSCTYGDAPLSETPAASSGTAPFDSFTGTLKEGGLAIAVVTGIDLSLENGLEPQYAVGSRDAVAVRWGRSSLTGTLSAFFTDSTLLRKFMEETAASLELTLTHGESSYVISIPNITYTGAENAASGDDMIQLSMPFAASLDETLGTNIQITRSLA